MARIITCATHGEPCQDDPCVTCGRVVPLMKHAECRVPRCYRQTRNTNGHCYDHQPNGFARNRGRFSKGRRR